MREPVFVIMAKQPAVGRTKTRLCPPLMPEEAAALYEALLRDTVELVAGLEGTRPAIAVTPPEATDEFRCFSPPDVILLPVAGRDIGMCARHARQPGERVSEKSRFAGGGVDRSRQFLPGKSVMMQLGQDMVTTVTR